MRTVRAGLWFLATVETAIGVVATFLPGVFYERVPWVAPMSPFSEHLVRDYGAMNLAVALVLTVAAVTGAPLLVRTALGGQAVFALAHLLIHATHVDLSDPGAAATELLALGVAAVLPTVLLLVSACGSGRASPRSAARTRCPRRSWG